MKIIKGLLIVFAAFLLLPSCQERMICPAYQSTYIFDEETRYQLFTRFEKDSIPKEYAGVDKSVYGLIKPTSRKKRERQMATVAMRNVMPVKKDDSLTTSATDITPLKRQMNND